MVKCTDNVIKHILLLLKQVLKFHQMISICNFLESIERIGVCLATGTYELTEDLFVLCVFGVFRPT